MKTIIFAFCALILTGFAFGQSSLKEELDEFRTQFEAIAPEEKIVGYAAGIASVKESGVVDKAKQTGDQAVNFTLPNAAGESVELKELLKNGPVVVTWYRGGWCPYCNMTLRSLQRSLPAIKEAGGQLVALTPEIPEKALSTKEQNDLGFQVLTDLNNRIAKGYGLVFQLTPFVEDAMRQFAGLKKWNGAEYNERELPLSATYIIDTTGTIRWAFLDAEYRNRAEPEEIVRQLKTIKAK